MCATMCRRMHTGMPPSPEYMRNGPEGIVRKGYKWGPGGASTNVPGIPAKVVLRIIPNETTASNLLLAGQLNWALVAGDDRRRLDARGLANVTVPAAGAWLWFNHLGGRTTADKRVRQALVQALDLDEVIRVNTGGSGTAATGLVAMDPKPCPGDTVRGRLPRHDVLAAQAALEQAGWTKGADGIRTKDGRPLSIDLHYSAASSPDKPTAELLAQRWKAIGVRTKINADSITTMNQVVFKTSNYDIYMQGGLCETQFEEVESPDGAERCRVGVARTPVVGVHNSPGLEVRYFPFDDPAPFIDESVEFFLPIEQFTFRRFPKWGNQPYSDVSLVAEAVRRINEVEHSGFFDRLRVVGAARQRVGNVQQLPVERNDELVAVTGRLVLTGVQLRCIRPRPAGAQRAVHDGDASHRLARHLRNELLQHLRYQDLDLADRPRDGRLIHIQKLADDLLSDVVLHIHHRRLDGLIQRQRALSSRLRMPGAKMHLHTITQVDELLG